MNKEDFKDYFQNYYQKDMEIYRKIYPSNENGWDEGICSHATYTILKERLYEKFHNFEYFILCNYEFNLIIQVVYTHFRHNWEKFKEILPEFIYLEAGFNFINGGCAITTPWGLLYQFKNRPKKLNLKSFEFSKEDRLEADLFFKEYLVDIFDKHPELRMTWEIFVQAMLEDEDIQNQLKKLSQSN